MNEIALAVPMGIVLSGAALAALFSIDAVQRRLSVPQMSGVLALAPMAALYTILLRIPDILDGRVLTWRFSWLPSLGMTAGFYVDGLSTLFAVIITFIGALVVVYAGQYFKGDPGAWRFFLYLLVFMAAMLGLVMAGDVVTLFVFWEATSIVSFLLVAYAHSNPEARRGGFKALVITGAGGVSLLIGLLLAADLSGGTEWEVILKSGDILRGSSTYPLILGLALVGAFTKSAQFPFHIWLPRAMTAPTPASAYLHSATMVKAGIYLMARMNPALGQTELWFWLLTGVGMTTMVTGAYQGLKQNDLKAILAYATICQLGIFTMMIGQGIAMAYKAMVVGVAAHAMYKSALFLVVGILDHETGTRDIRRLGGLWRQMPATFAIALVASLSMAGLPPLFGFLAKETLLATTVHSSVPENLAWVLPASTVVAGALILAQSGMLVWEVFLGRPGDPAIHGHEAPMLMLLAPAIPTLMSFSDALSPDSEAEARLLALAASAAHGADVKVSLHMWSGLTVPMMLSVAAVSMGTILFFYRRQIRAFQARAGGRFSLDILYDMVFRCIDAAAGLATRFQVGRLRVYLSVIIGGTSFLVLGLTGIRLPPVTEMLNTWPHLDFPGELMYLRIFALGLTVGTALASVFLRRDFWAILAAGVSGLGMALLLVLEPAPDVALVQIVVDILTLVILVLALSRIPTGQRREAHEVTFKQTPYGLVRDTLVAAAGGLVVMVITFEALSARPHDSVLTPYFAANAEILAGSKSIVGAIIVDFRALDTLIEITVFSMAGLGIFMLLRHAAQKHGDTFPHAAGAVREDMPLGLGVQGRQVSPFIRTLAHLILPIAMIIGALHILYGHDQPGDGFTAGVIISLAIGFWYVVFGYHETRRRLRWLRPSSFIGSGILLIILSGAAGAVVKGSFLASVDFSHLLGAALPKGVHLGTSLLFEFAICLSVVGSVAHMVNTLGIPGEWHPERADADNE
ncbi:hydrogen gas-evolving membrane-bound hydrogenase subunit E [Desulfococcus sp.]|uniref:hydrogen gas-evolving membrane-bound hydrogenase subunit E n=1 Tax=Desulfococcus sp. TaxID=2025834 RepID=UPI0035949363